MADLGHPPPPVEGHGRLVRLAVHLAVELEGRVAAQHEAVEGSAADADVEHGLGLRPGQQRHRLGGVEAAPRRAFRLRHGRVLVDSGADQDRLDARGAQQRQPGGRGARQVQGNGHADQPVRLDAWETCRAERSNWT
nr:hypothetical protein GCM10025699_46090 [Microbacterium flavescens]